MTFKKAVIIFVLVYGLIGLYFYGPKLFKEKEKEVAPSTTRMQVELEWDVNNELNGNFRTPAWLKDSKLTKYVKEEEYSGDVLGDPDFTSAYQLMSLLAQLQLGDPTLSSSFLNPDLSHTDYDGKKVAEITERAAELSAQITKNHSLSKVKISRATIGKQKDVVSHDVILQFNDGEEIVVKNIPMIQLSNDHGDGSQEEDSKQEQGMWYMNINLHELAQRVEKKE